jgi:hypothetical protein
MNADDGLFGWWVQPYLSRSPCIYNLAEGDEGGPVYSIGKWVAVVRNLFLVALLGQIKSLFAQLRGDGLKI